MTAGPWKWRSWAVPLAALTLVGCSATGSSRTASVPSWPASPYDPDSPISREDVHIGGVPGPDRYVRSPWDRYALDVITKPDPEHSQGKLQLFRVRSYTPYNPVQGSVGPVVFQDRFWYGGDDGAVALWDIGTDRVWIIVQYSRYAGGRSEVRLLTPNAAGVWSDRVVPPAEDRTFPAQLKANLPQDFFAVRAEAFGTSPTGAATP